MFKSNPNAHGKRLRDIRSSLKGPLGPPYVRMVSYLRLYLYQEFRTRCMKNKNKIKKKNNKSKQLNQLTFFFFFLAPSPDSIRK